MSRLAWINKKNYVTKINNYCEYLLLPNQKIELDIGNLRSPNVRNWPWSVSVDVGEGRAEVKIIPLGSTEAVAVILVVYSSSSAHISSISPC
jgi:hypothetical protein